MFNQIANNQQQIQEEQHNAYDMNSVKIIAIDGHQYQRIGRYLFHHHRQLTIDNIRTIKQFSYKKLQQGIKKLTINSNFNQFFPETIFKLIDRFMIKELSELIITRNQFCHLYFLPKFYLPNLSYLNLSENHIENIESIANCQFIHLRSLILDKNNITTIDSLRKTSFYQLERLLIENNFINQIYKLNQFCFPELEQIDLCNDLCITQIQAIVRGNFNNEFNAKFYHNTNVFKQDKKPYKERFLFQ